LNWITDFKIPIGPWAKAFVDWLTTNADWFFNQLAFILSHVIDGILFILQKPHPLIVVLGITAIAYGCAARSSLPCSPVLGCCSS
jgi:glycine betaine/proline transport system permease protein